MNTSSKHSRTLRLSHYRRSPVILIKSLDLPHCSIGLYGQGQIVQMYITIHSAFRSTPYQQTDTIFDVYDSHWNADTMDMIIHDNNVRLFSLKAGDSVND